MRILVHSSLAPGGPGLRVTATLAQRSPDPDRHGPERGEPALDSLERLRRGQGPTVRPRVSSVQPPTASTFFTQSASRPYVSATM